MAVTKRRDISPSLILFLLIIFGAAAGASRKQQWEAELQALSAAIPKYVHVKYNMRITE
jgi:hypothetical protein